MKTWVPNPFQGSILEGVGPLDGVQTPLVSWDAGALIGILSMQNGADGGFRGCLLGV